MSLVEYDSDPLITLRAGALLVQDVVKQQFFHENSRELLNNKKIGMVATEAIVYENKKSFCIISTLCESIDFSKMSNHSVYDYNNQKSVMLKDYLGTEILPILRVISNEDKTKVIIFEDKIKYDFFSYTTSSKKSTSLLYQLLSGKELIRTLSSEKISNIFSLVHNRDCNAVNSYSGVWRNNFINLQREHLRNVNDLNLIQRYEQGLSDYFHLK